jgi:hypothetical protein
MNPLLIGPIFEFGKAILERFIPDPEKKREAELEMFRMAAEGEMKQVLAQLEINAREAMHPSVWTSGWRPFFGWVGGVGFLYSTVLQPMLVWYGASRGWAPPPEIGIDLLWVVITGMLGIGGLRTYEKKAGLSK